jgi:hypothetical protein
MKIGGFLSMVMLSLAIWNEEIGGIISDLANVV